MTTSILSALCAEALDIAPCPNSEVIDIAYNVDSLRVTVKDLNTDAELVVEFVEVEGFRVLDEGDLLEFWPICSRPYWLFQITAGGWLDQECSRPGFAARETKNVFEYFIGGVNACVSVLAWSPPVVTSR